MKIKMSTLAAVAGISTLSIMAYKKINPDMMEDMKYMIKNKATKMLKGLENMDKTANNN